jgi:lysophospholipase L1-like esterase
MKQLTLFQALDATLEVHQKLSVKKIKYYLWNKLFRTMYLVLCLLCLLSFPTSANRAIAIDGLRQSLVAPQAQSYQWYHNNQKIEAGNAQFLKVSESGFYSVEMRDKSGKLTTQSKLIMVSAAGAIITVHTIGDSTVQIWNSGYYPKKGWGQVLQYFFNAANVVIDDKAVGGTSSKSFYDNYWTAVKNSLQAGDFVFIQFGINDAVKTDPLRYTIPMTTFKDYLTLYVNETKAKGAIPVLVSTLNRNAWNATTPPTVYAAYHDYPVATRQLAATLNVPLIDLDLMCTSLLQSVGPDYSTNFIYMNLAAGDYANYPTGQADNVHFQEMGAIEMAKLIVKGIRNLSGDANVSKLIPYLTPTYKVTFSSNNSSAGLVTRTEYFPSGITVTAKAWPYSGHAFSSWSGDLTGTKAISSFTMGTTAKNITANFDSNSSTNTAIYQAENATLSLAVTETTNAGYTGTSYVNTNNVVGSYIEWTVTPSVAGSYGLEFRHANGTTTDRPADVSVNGTKVISALSFPGTGAFTTWALTSKQTVTLNAAANKIRITATTANGCSNIDYLQVSGAGTLKSDEMTVGLDDNAVSEIPMAYPNPLTGNTLWLKLRLEKASNVKVIVYNSVGGLAYQKDLGFYGVGVANQSLDLSSLPKGTYVFHVLTNGGEKTQKLVRM